MNSTQVIKCKTPSEVQQPSSERVQRTRASTRGHRLSQRPERRSTDIIAAPSREKAGSCSILADSWQMRTSVKMRSLWQEVDKVIQ